MTEGIIWYLPFEEQFIVWLQHLGDGTILQNCLILLNNFFSFLGEEILCIAILGFVYWGLDKKKGERIGIVVMMVTVSIGVLKNVFVRVRPWASCDSIELLRDVDGFSFPSGHSATCTALYPTVAREYKNKRWLGCLAVCIPLLCGISRCYVGAHWPTDVIVGLAVGLLIFGLAEMLLPRMRSKYVFYGLLILMGSVGLLYCTTKDYYNGYGMLVGFVLGLRFEETHTRFENTCSIPIAILRTAAGGILYFILSTVIKVLIGGIFPAESFGSLLMRSIRYGLVVFLLIGIYPYAFRLEKKIFPKKKES